MENMRERGNFLQGSFSIIAHQKENAVQEIEYSK